MHTVLYGPPGTGKTEVAKILGNIFCNLGILKSNTFKKVTRSDLVAGYLGQTAIKTREVIDAAIGGVLFIDEAYALGNKPWPSLLDGLGNGLGYTWILLLVAAVRELLGSGAISFPGAGQIKLLPQEWFISNGGVYENNNLVILPPMALILVGIIIWVQRSRNTSLIEEN